MHYFIVESVSKSRSRFILRRECIRDSGKIFPGEIYRCYIPVDVDTIPQSGTFKVMSRTTEPTPGRHFEMKLIAVEGSLDRAKVVVAGSRITRSSMKRVGDKTPDPEILSPKKICLQQNDNIAFSMPGTSKGLTEIKSSRGKPPLNVMKSYQYLEKTPAKIPKNLLDDPDFAELSHNSFSHLSFVSNLFTPNKINFMENLSSTPKKVTDSSISFEIGLISPTQKTITALKKKLLAQQNKIICQAMENKFLKSSLKQLENQLTEKNNEIKEKNGQIKERNEQLVNMLNIVARCFDNMESNRCAPLNKTTATTDNVTSAESGQFSQTGVLSDFMIDQAVESFEGLESFPDFTGKMLKELFQRTHSNNTVDDNKMIRFSILRAFPEEKLSNLCFNKSKVRTENQKLIEISPGETIDLFNIYKRRLDIFKANKMYVADIRYHQSTFSRVVSTYLPRLRSLLLKKAQQIQENI